MKRLIYTDVKSIKLAFQKLQQHKKTNDQYEMINKIMTLANDIDKNFDISIYKLYRLKTKKLFDNDICNRKTAIENILNHAIDINKIKEKLDKVIL